MRVEKMQLVAKQLDDETLNHKEWLWKLRRLHVTSQESLAAVVGNEHCLMFDGQWYYYRLPKKTISWAMGNDSKYLWSLDESNKLAVIDLGNGEWMRFESNFTYADLIYAEGDVVAASFSNLQAIDVLKLTSGGSIARVASLAIESLSQFNNISDLEKCILNCSFVPERERFFVLNRYAESRDAPLKYYVLESVSIDGKTEVVLELPGINALVRPPFVVILCGTGDTLMYADLREDTVEQKWQTLNFNPELDKFSWKIDNAFALDDDLIISLSARQVPKWRLLRLGQKPEILYEAKSTPSVYRMLGSLFISDNFVFNCISQKKEGEKLSSGLLRQAIQDAVKRQQKIPSVRLLHKMSQNAASNDVDHLRFALHKSPLSTEELAALVEKANYSDFVSSARGEMVFSGSDLVHLITQHNEQLKLLLPMQQSRSPWKKFTFDEQERVWICDEKGHHVAVISPKQREAQVFALNSNRFTFDKLDQISEIYIKKLYGSSLVNNLYVSHIAAYADTLVTVHRFKQARHREIALLTFCLLSFHRYDGKSLEEIACIQHPGVIAVKPDREGKGWWLLQQNYRGKLSFLETQTMNNETVMSFPDYTVPALLGDWPEKVYFAYLDKDENENYSLCYTLDPREGWCKVPLHDIFGMHVQKYLYPSIVSMHSLNGSVFALLSVRSDKSPEAWLLICLQSGYAELIAAFTKDKPTYFVEDEDRNEITLARWRDMLVLRKAQPFIVSSGYASEPMITKLPNNTGVLFYKPDMDYFSSKPIITHSITETLHKMIKRTSFGESKHLL